MLPSPADGREGKAPLGNQRARQAGSVSSRAPDAAARGTWAGSFARVRQEISPFYSQHRRPSGTRHVSFAAPPHARHARCSVPSGVVQLPRCCAVPAPSRGATCLRSRRIISSHGHPAASGDPPCAPTTPRRRCNLTRRCHPSFAQSRRTSDQRSGENVIGTHPDEVGGPDQPASLYPPARSYTTLPSLPRQQFVISTMLLSHQ